MNFYFILPKKYFSIVLVSLNYKIKFIIRAYGQDPDRLIIHSNSMLIWKDLSLKN